MVRKVSRQRGFTLLELVLSMGLVGILAGFSIPIYQSFQVRNDLDIEVGVVTVNLRRAELLSQAVSRDVPGVSVAWGVKVLSDSVTLFNGQSFATRDPSLDEVFNLPSSVTPSGLTEFLFLKWSGIPQTIGSLTLTSITNESRVVSINAKGLVSY